MTDQLDWTHKTVDIPAGGLRHEREATPAEREGIVRALGLLGLGRLSVRYRIEAIAGDAYRLSGAISGDVEQACVVTLEPVAARIDERFDVEFWPHVETTNGNEEISVLEGRDVEKLERGIIPAGRIVFETFASSLDPYPRREGAAFNWQDPNLAGDKKANPFAVLSKLKGED